MNSKLLYGKDQRENITGIEGRDSDAIVYYNDGTSEEIPYERYILFKAAQIRGRCGKLEGKNPLKYFAKYKDKSAYYQAKKTAPYGHCFTPRDDQQSIMLKTGITMYQGMKYEDLSILSFDIETNGLTMNADSIVYMISMTLRDKTGQYTSLFSLDNYDTQQDMINDFCKRVRALNPDVLTGHNIIGFDLPYLKHVAGKLKLGRDQSDIWISNMPRRFRKDGHKQYDYNNVKCHGREIVDTFYLSMKYDFQNKYNSYGLKSIIEQEGLIKEGRQFYDAKTIKDNWKIDSEREKIKAYCKDDSLDSLNLLDLMLPSYFYHTQTLAMGLQECVLTGSGSQINGIMLRSYLQDRKSLPEPTHTSSFEGAISFGNPGLYSHVNKVDIRSQYPSIMLQYNIYDERKDPENNFLKIVKLLTDQRLRNKQTAKVTGDRYYKDLEQAQKILINSAYGFLATQGLHFNNPVNAARITKYGREILQTGIDWAELKGYSIVNADTDSFSYTTSSQLSNDEFNSQIEDLNTQFDNGIIWDNDGRYKRVIIVKAKNYVLQGYDKEVTIKGSGLKATMKEPALKEFISEFIYAMLNNRRGPSLVHLYNQYVAEIMNIEDMERWCSRKNITKVVLDPIRTNEKRIFAALKGRKVHEGDKIKVFFDTNTSLCMLDDFDGIYDVDKLLEKLYKTVKILETVVDIKLFPNYKLKKNKELLETFQEVI